MLCPGHDPDWREQLDGSLFAAFNCGPAGCACAIDDVSCGKKMVTAARIRTLSGDKDGGMNLGQLAVVARANFGIRLEVHYGMPVNDFDRERRKGRGAIAAVGYRPFRDSRFRGSETFVDNHGIYIPPDLKVRDSLTDGRRKSIYQFKNETYPWNLIVAGAGAVNIGSKTAPKLLGAGKINVALTVDQEPSGYRIHVAPGPLDWWRIVAGKAERYIRGAQAKGWSPKCTAPAFYMWPKHGPVSLVQVLEGGGKGRWICTTAPRVRVEVIP